MKPYEITAYVNGELVKRTERGSHPEQAIEVFKSFRCPKNAEIVIVCVQSSGSI